MSGLKAKYKRTAEQVKAAEREYYDDLRASWARRDAKSRHAFNVMQLRALGKIEEPVTKVVRPRWRLPFKELRCPQCQGVLKWSKQTRRSEITLADGTKNTMEDSIDFYECPKCDYEWACGQNRENLGASANS